MASEIKSENSTTRIVRVLTATYFTQGIDPISGQTVRYVLDAPRGAEIEVPVSEAKRLESIGAVLPEGATSDDAFEHQAALLDHYRGQRGDQEALNRALERARQQAPVLNDGGVVNLDAPVGQDAQSLSAFLSENRLNIDDTVALAENDPEKARKVLEAERLSTGGSPRSGVESRLSKIIEG